MIGHTQHQITAERDLIGLRTGHDAGRTVAALAGGDGVGTGRQAGEDEITVGIAQHRNARQFLQCHGRTRDRLGAAGLDHIAADRTVLHQANTLAQFVQLQRLQRERSGIGVVVPAAVDRLRRLQRRDTGLDDRQIGNLRNERNQRQRGIKVLAPGYVRVLLRQ